MTDEEIKLLFSKLEAKITQLEVNFSGRLGTLGSSTNTSIVLLEERITANLKKTLDTIDGRFKKTDDTIKVLASDISGLRGEINSLKEREIPKKKEPIPKELLIQRIHYPKWWNDEGIAKIQLTSSGSQLVITAKGDYTLYIAAIVLTVSGECDITFTFGSAGSSGGMNLGGDDEPRGIVIAMGNSPAPCGTGSFMISATSTESVAIGGFVSYFLWKKEKTT